MLDDKTEIEPVYKAIGKRVLEERLHAGWTQQDLCGQVGLARASIANIELGRQRVMLHQVMRLAEVLDVSLGEFIGVAVDAENDSVTIKRLRDENVALRRRTAKLEATLRSLSDRASAALSDSN